VRAGNVAGQISHLNARHDTNAPPGAWHKAVELMSASRVAGLDVQADMTPFRHGLGAMTGLLPNWLLADGYRPAAQRLADPLVRSRLRGDCDRYWRFVHKGQWHRVRLQNSPQFPELDGLTFDEIARRRQRDEWDCYFDILAAAGDDMDNLTLVGELFTDEHLAEMLTHPLFSLGVDAYTSVDHGPLSELTANPLPYSGHIHYLTHHVRTNRTLSLEDVGDAGLPVRAGRPRADPTRVPRRPRHLRFRRPEHAIHVRRSGALPRRGAGGHRQRHDRRRPRAAHRKAVRPGLAARRLGAYGASEAACATEPPGTARLARAAS